MINLQNKLLAIFSAQGIRSHCLASLRDASSADRIASVGAKTYRPEIGGDRRRGSAARAGGDAVERRGYGCSLAISS